MPQRTPARPGPTLFRKSCLATAIVALAVVPSACSTVPAGGDVPRDDALVEAGLDTRDAGERNWNRIMYLLGFSEEAKRASGRAAAAERARGGSPSGNAPLLDEVDWALMEEDAPMPSSGTDTDVVASAAFEEQIEEQIEEEAVVVVASTEEGASVEDTLAGDTLAGGTLVEETLDGKAGVDAGELRTGSRALEHEVGDSETLWDIAKATTGDATNWHVLADVNDLDPDAAVYPGQVLTIPADLVRPELTAETEAFASVPASEQGSEAGDTPPVAAAALPSREFELDADETLWDLAKRTTGDATNWRAIAEANGFTNREASLVRPGQSIAVPLTLVREPLAERSAPLDAETGTGVSGTIAEPQSADDAVATASGTGDAGNDLPETSTVESGGAVPDVASGEGEAVVIRLPDVDAAGPLEPISAAAPPSEPVRRRSLPATPPARRSPGPDALQAAGDGGSSTEGTLRIVDAAYRSGGAGTATEPKTTATDSPEPPAKIMVSGTYYPKAVYNEADFSSSLLMRVSPGTTLQVSRALGPWYEVQTEQGKGYVHTRDIK